MVAAKQMGSDVTLEIQGFAEAGDEANQSDLAQRRANKVRDFLTSCGFDPKMLHPVAMQPTSNSAATAKTAQSPNRVSFKVTTRDSVPGQ
jgi:outer membrane protein OmpA-like peptidoglycan-associated protein